MLRLPKLLSTRQLVQKKHPFEVTALERSRQSAVKTAHRAGSGVTLTDQITTSTSF